jgi:hypothetical protein
MKTGLILFALLAISVSCTTTKKPLYTWGNYETTSYNYLKKSDENSILKLIENYQKVIETQEGTRGVVPPGVCADYGFILLQKGKTEEGKEMLMKEIALYPESKIFIERILKMTEE